jgi:5-methylcytosine-specific restriction endonuclease McrA
MMQKVVMVNSPVLVLNVGYEPLNICRVRRAIILIEQEKAEMLEDGSGFVRSADRTFAIPSVIRVSSSIRRPRRSNRKLTRMEIFRRDEYRCQYCGRQVKQLTLDHVIPRFRGGPQTWENVVSACVPCNRTKAGRTPKEAGMRLLRQPGPPDDDGVFFVFDHHREIREEWKKYLPPFKAA